MKLKNVITFIFDNIIFRKKTFLFSVVLFGVSFTLIGNILSEYNENKIVEYRVKECFDSNTSKIRSINLIDENTSEYNKFTQKVSEIKEIDHIGNYKYTYINFKELSNNINIKQINVECNKNEPRLSRRELTKVLEIDDTFIDLCNIKDDKGKQLRALNDEVAIYVGKDFEEYLHMGMKLTYEDKRNKREYKCRVLGVLKENTKWLNEDFLNGVSEELGDNLNNKIVMIKKFDSKENMGVFYFTIDKEKNNEYVYEKIRKLYKKYNVHSANDIKKNILELIREKRKDDMMRISSLIIMVVLVTLISILSTSSMAIVSIISRKRIYGILYTCGICKKDLVKIISGENFIKVFIGVIVGNIYNGLSVILDYQGYADRIQTLLYIQFRITIWELIIMGIIIFILSTFVPLVILKRMSPSEMIGGNC